MKQDIISDALNNIMNAKRAGKSSITINRYSKLLLNLLNMAKELGYLDYAVEDNSIKINLSESLNEFKAIKPRYNVPVEKINKYVRRFLPARDFGFVVVSTSKGLMLHGDAESKHMGGCLIAYIY